MRVHLFWFGLILICNSSRSGVVKTSVIAGDYRFGITLALSCGERRGSTEHPEEQTQGEGKAYVNTWSWQ